MGSTAFPSRPQRRTVLRGLLAGGALATASACSSSNPTPKDPTISPTTSTSATSGSDTGRVLLAYFSRPGENYYYGKRRDLKVGNTEVLASMIADRITCDVHRIEAADPYSDSYDDTVARNVREQEGDARPDIANPLRSIERYDTILLGSPIWNVRAPMIMTTFTEDLDFRGKTVVPITTYAMSGLGTTERDYRASCRGATIADGLAVQGEEVRDSGDQIDAWVRRLGLPTR
ncbi:MULTISPECIES: flavodoxin [unclassified Streptomyces]|uniref:flavodoxin n=1 Tax=unclassified Streptomyces TaxID=2593676 RepID=UPI002E19B52D|nr:MULTISPECIES: flavodoxin [unclassified Streptomyces]